MPVVDFATGGTNLTALGGGGLLGAASWPGFGTALNTIDGGQNDTNTAARDAYLSCLPLVNGAGDNVSIVVADPTTGAFTMEALVWVGFDPAVNLGSLANGGNGRGTTLQIITGEDEANAGRIFQFRIDPIGTASPLNLSEPMLEFINVRQAASGQVQNMLAPLPMTGPDAIVSNGWYHVAVTYDGNQNTPDNLKFYWTRMDASRTAANLLGTITMVNDLSVAPTDFAIGNIGRNPSQNAFLGLIDEVRISRGARGPGNMMFAPPLITIDQQPASQTVALGQSASFSVVAGGIPPLFYQWRLGGEPITGATSSLYSIPAAQSSDAGNYDVVVSNLVSVPVTSQVAVLTVRTPGNLQWYPTADYMTWDLSVANWREGGANVPFGVGDVAVFDNDGLSLSPYALVTEPVLVGGLAADVPTSGTLTITTLGPGTLSGNAALVKTGPGTLVMDVNSSCSGPTTVAAGTLQIGQGSAQGSLGNGPVTNNGALVFNRTGALTIAGRISGTGSVEQQGTGLGTTWWPVAGSAEVHSIVIPINPANPAVFYRLTLPQ